MVKTPNIGSVFYSPGQPPEKPDDLPRFLRDELAKVALAISALAVGHLDKSNAAPTKPREGDLRFADGTAWNPGAGQGVYAYYGGAWHLLG